jgi:predicted transcriptional regulator
MLHKRVVLDTTLCDKVLSVTCDRSVVFPDTPVSSTNKTDCHDIAEILLKVVLNNINQTNIEYEDLPALIEDLTVANCSFNCDVEHVRFKASSNPQSKLISHHLQYCDSYIITLQERIKNLSFEKFLKQTKMKCCEILLMNFVH